MNVSHAEQYSLCVCAVLKENMNNHIPSVHTMRVQTVKSHCPLPPAPHVPPQMESSSAAKTKNDKAWRNVSEEIKRIFRTAVLQLQEKGTMKSAQAKKFLCSG